MTTRLLQSTDPDMMIVFFGANDASLDIAPQSILLQEYENNLRVIVKEIKNVRCFYYIFTGSLRIC